MKQNIKATSIIEALVVLLIVVTWVTWVYSIYTKSIKISNNAWNKITALSIAKQGIEVLTNIRDTNWLMYWGDIKHCWNSLNYSNLCLWSTDNTYKIKNNTSYIIERNNIFKWTLSSKNTNTFGDSDYRNDFKVWLDSKWIYAQWANINSELSPIFTREIKIRYLKEDWISWDENDDKILIQSIVTWVDDSSSKIQQIEIEQILTNWKK
jgi:hypothetical protein